MHVTERSSPLVSPPVPELSLRPTVSAEPVFPLAMRFFGTAEITIHGAPITPLPRPVVALLALLTLQKGGARERTSLAETLWPDAVLSRSLFYLRRTLSTLRTALGPERGRLCAPTTSGLSLDLSGVFCDVLAFDAAARQDAAESLDRAAQLYRGPLLEGWEEPWAVSHREPRAHQFADVLEKLATLRTQQENLSEAAHLLRRALSVAPLRESNHVRLMEVLARRGDHAGVEWQFQNLRRTLREEFNGVPALTTVETYRRLRAQPETKPRPPSLTSTHSDTVPTTRIRLPCPVTSFVGRAAVIGAIAASVDAHRMVTLVGPGGVGKTRLAIAVAEDRAPVYVEGVEFVDLAAIRSPDRVSQEISAALGLRSGSDTYEESLCQHLHVKRFLLALDNVEHIADSCRLLIGHLLERCPFLHILCTSHRAIRCTGEHIVRIAPLALPPLVTPAPPRKVTAGQLTELSRFDAIALLVDRASAHNRSFRLTTKNAPTITELCRRLDGLPLALEIAAAQLRHLTPQEVLARLDNASPALSLPRREQAIRHRSLRAMLKGSYELLSEGERLLLTRLSLFVGGATREMVEAVCADMEAKESGENFLLAGDIEAHLTSLVEKSLLTDAEEGHGQKRYRLLETIRSYAAQQLTADDAQRCSARLARHTVQLVDLARSFWAGPDETFWMGRLMEELPNLRVALRWCSTPDDQHGSTAHSESAGERHDRRETGLTLATRLMRFWWLHGYITEGRQWLSDTLAACQDGAEMPPELTAAAFNACGTLAGYQGDSESAELYHQKALEIRRARDDKRGVAVSLHNLGALYHGQGDFARARTLVQAALDLYRELGDRRGEGSNLLLLGGITLHQGDLDAAELLLNQSLAIGQGTGDLLGDTLVHNLLGRTATRRGQMEKARDHFRYCLEVKQTLGDTVGIVGTLENMAEMLALEKKYHDLLRLCGAIAAWREAMQLPRTALADQQYEEGTAFARADLGAEAAESAWDEGYKLPLSDTAAHALRLCGAEEEASVTPPSTQ